MKAGINQVVGYVAPPARPGGSTTIKQGIVLESFADGTARIDVTEYGEDGKPRSAKESWRFAVRFWHGPTERFIHRCAAIKVHDTL